MANAIFSLCVPSCPLWFKLRMWINQVLKTVSLGSGQKQHPRFQPIATRQKNAQNLAARSIERPKLSILLAGVE